MTVLYLTPDLILQYGDVTLDMSATGLKTLAVTFDEAFASLIAWDALICYGAANMDIQGSTFYDGTNVNTQPTTSGMTLEVVVSVAGSGTNRIRWWAIGMKKRPSVLAR